MKVMVKKDRSTKKGESFVLYKIKTNPMKGLFSLLFTLIQATTLIGQTDSESHVKAQQPLGYIAPMLPGGDSAFANYMTLYLNYPRIEMEYGIEGEVILKMYINKNGRIDSIATTGKHKVFMDEVRRVARLSPKWIPGSIDGETIDTTKTLRVLFSIGKSKADKYKDRIENVEVLMVKVPLLSSANSESHKKYMEATEQFKEGVKLLEEGDYQEAVRFFVLAEQMGYRRIDLYQYRAAAFFYADKLSFACKDWLEAFRRGNEESGKKYYAFCFND